MDIRVLKYFVAVAKEKNITRAAESLHIAQPSLSKQLIELENELGKQLLIRSKRKIDLTDDGVLLLKRAEEIITLFDKTQQELSRDSETIGGKISIGGMMINVMCPVRTVHFQRTNWAKNNQLQPITYEFCIAV